jgi:serine/threonine protein kinase
MPDNDPAEYAIEREYEREAKLGEGTYGVVYKARKIASQEVVAMKQIRLDHEEEGVPSTAIREISLLKELTHPNVVKLLDVRCSHSSLYLIFEFVEQDLRQYLKRKGVFWGKELRSAGLQLLEAVHCLHAHRILHRDLKPQNLLIDKVGRIKVADFGLARAFNVPIKPFTHEVVTLWYRAPEILLGIDRYSTPVDIWSCGCIFSEMATGQALFPGDSEIDTLFKIFQVLGTPTAEQWPGLIDLPDFKRTFPKWKSTNFQPTRMNEIRRKAPMVGEQGLVVLGKMLRYDPVSRPAARTLSEDPYFAEVRTDVEALTARA